MLLELDDELVCLILGRIHPAELRNAALTSKQFTYFKVRCGHNLQ
jgi:hypothetical protein